jgi:tetratricopeptide (TPR) repeat protein
MNRRILTTNLLGLGWFVAVCNVQAIVNGRIIQRGNELTLHIELVDVSSETALWSADYNRSMTDLVSLQSEIARDVSNKMRKLSGEDEQKLEKNYTRNAEAYQLYLKGRFYWNKRTAESYQKAIDYFRQAIEKDPNYALAYTSCGHKADALRVMNELLELSKAQCVSPHWFAAVQASLGNKDEAFRWLDQTIDRRFGPMIYLKVNPIRDPLRSDPRFAERLRRVGLSQ